MKNLKLLQPQNMTIGHLATAIPAEEVHTWPDHSKLAVIHTISKCGLPDIMSSEVMIWRRNGDPLIIEKHHGLMGQAS